MQFLDFNKARVRNRMISVDVAFVDLDRFLILFLFIIIAVQIMSF